MGWSQIFFYAVRERHRETLRQLGVEVFMQSCKVVQFLSELRMSLPVIAGSLF